MYGKETQYQTFIKAVRNPYSAQPERIEEGLKVQTVFFFKSLSMHCSVLFLQMNVLFGNRLLTQNLRMF